MNQAQSPVKDITRWRSHFRDPNTSYTKTYLSFQRSDTLRKTEYLSDFY